MTVANGLVFRLKTHIMIYVYIYIYVDIMCVYIYIIIYNMYIIHYDTGNMIYLAKLQ